jgi:hypothetical protein
LDYEQFPFKCKLCHEYGHFARNCKKVEATPPSNGREEKWQVVSRKMGINGNRAQSATDTSNGGSITSVIEMKSPTKWNANPYQKATISSSKQFEYLSQLEEIAEEGIHIIPGARTTPTEQPLVQISSQSNPKLSVVPLQHKGNTVIIFESSMETSIDPIEPRPKD